MRLVIALVLLLPACWLRDQCSDGESVCGVNEKVIECVDGQYYEGNHRCCPMGSRCVEGETAGGDEIAGCTMTGVADPRCAGVGARRHCDGKTLVTCDVLGFASAEQICAGDCVVDRQGHAACAFATDARCASFANPTSFGCDGDTLFECHEGRLVSERSCSDLGAVCRTSRFELAACALPGSQCAAPAGRCEANRAVVCHIDGYETITPCANGTTCEASRGGAWCGSPSCW